MRADMEAVAAAAIAWNRARLQRITAAKAVPAGALCYTAEEHTMRLAKQAEARAKAQLRKMCAKADPTCVVLETEARSPKPRLPSADIIDI
ncbi:hypothetical protein ACUTR7_24890 [Delftia sp. NA_296.1]|uniref:hypothetical protein n=1 Tax=Delftia sp. NA_296.1 TaxID=3415648 RepID=UPI00404679E8